MDVQGVIRARKLVSDQSHPLPAPQWSSAELAGRVCELCGEARVAEDGVGATAQLTAATRLLAEAHRAGDPVAWICCGSQLFFAPDLETNGVDLQAVSIVRVDDSLSAVSAAEQLLRSGCFGVIVVDLTGLSTQKPISDALIGRLAGPARTHHTVMLFLNSAGTDAPPPAAAGNAAAVAVGKAAADNAAVGKAAAGFPGVRLGSMISLRAHAHCRALSDGRFLLQVDVIKDKRRGAAWRWTETWHGPPGLS